jgi:hypothetical protein
VNTHLLTCEDVLLGDDQRKRILRTSAKQEKRTAKTYNGRVQKGSGNTWLQSNDVRSSVFLIENKFTNNTSSFTIKEVDLSKLRKNALQEDRIPVLQFDLANRRYVVLTEDDFLEMIEND